MNDVFEAFSQLRHSARALRQLPAETRSQLLNELALTIENAEAEILDRNNEDLKRLASDTTAAFRDRLTVNPQRLKGMTESLRQVARLPDPVGEVVEERTLENGLQIRRVRAPLGVIFMIFESRPNVILEAFSLAFKSGNAIALRGGSESRSTAELIYTLIRKTLSAKNLSVDFFYGMNNYDRSLVEALLKRKDLIDVTVPRGGEKLIDFVQKTALMPVIKNDRGLCHAFIDKDANIDMAVAIVNNGKTQRPGVCNSLETVLVHEAIAHTFLPRLHEATEACGLQWRCDEKSLAILKGRNNLSPASEHDWDTEHLDLILNCRVVKDLQAALAHIEKHSSLHSEVIVTADEKNARVFQAEVDAAAVYWNASTRFTDGFELGLGGELGISTQKTHVRGPVGLRELTTPRWVIDGTGQIRV